ncbi:MAG: Ig-like domain-containing protein [Bacteroidota bacterium]|nr:Ig-like domain-containing protein [Bacteroidota bacterium]
MASIASNYGLVIFKHCYPGADIASDTGKPDVKSNRKSLENYKLQYRALRTLMDGMPDKKFMVWTLVPLHRLATSTDVAARANEFVKWVKTQWLTEDGKPHSNIFIFDFYSLAAEMNEKPTNGKQYCLKYDYEYSHSSNDSHPNTLANATIGPLFAQAVVQVLSTNLISKISVSAQSGATSITTDNGTLQMQTEILPADATSKSVSWEVINQTGKASISASGLLTAEKDGTVKAIATANDGSGIKGELTITISNQLIPIESIQIIDNLKNDTIIGIGTKINLKAIVSPSNATNQDVGWIVENITGKASIDSNGLLTTSSPGLIKVIAKALDQSQCITSKEYLIELSVTNRRHIISGDYKIFPNPTEGKIKIQIDQMPNSGVIVEIRDTKGQILLKKRVFESVTEWSLIQYPTSVFFITINDNNYIFTKKIVNAKIQK